MYDVTWRTGCTLTILMLLILLGSGRFLEGSDPVHAPEPTGEGTRTAASREVLSTPEPSAAHPTASQGDTSTAATADKGGMTAGGIRLPGTARFSLRDRMVQR
jgi:hypothetical protein